MSIKEYNIVFSFDTTGSMSGCIAQVRNKIAEIIDHLFKEIPGINIGLIAHGDYCDEKSTYLMKQVDITKNKNELIDFVKNVKTTCGGDTPEAYEYVLREVQKMSWTSSSVRVLVMVGDAYPHEKNDNPYKIDWRHEVDEIKDMGISIYSVQCLNHGNSTSKIFFKQISNKTNGYHLYLNQFQYIIQMMMAICYKQIDDETLMKYEKTLQDSTDTIFKLTDEMKRMFDIMLGRTTTEAVEEIEERTYSWSRAPMTRTRTRTLTATGEIKEDELRPSPPSRFQILDVETDTTIKDFTSSNGLTFKPGKGFYEFMKPETIQSTKEIVVLRKTDNCCFEGDNARDMLGLVETTKKIKPTSYPNYLIFVQSTSHSRKLLRGTKFLYDTLEDT
jgi:hypothetical protein